MVFVVVPIMALAPLTTLVLAPFFLFFITRCFGWYLQKKTDGRRALLMEQAEKDEAAYQLSETKGAITMGQKDDMSAKGSDWSGFIGFFHPFCNAGGGGERVLWAAIRATQERWPKAKCIVYTGDQDVDKATMLANVKERFGIDLHPPTVTFLYLSRRNWVHASAWPVFTLAGQSLGSAVLAWDAFSLLVPDVFIDTMGYAFALGLARCLFYNIPTGAYVHYPTISTDMLDSLNPNSTVGSQGVNAGRGTGASGMVKKLYWRLFACIYSVVGSSINVVMTNSSWTQGHIVRLWGPWRGASRTKSPISVNYPPVDVRGLERDIDLSPASEAQRQPLLLYIAQFRPEKDHQLIIKAFSMFLQRARPEVSKKGKLVLVGSVRDAQDSKRVYKLRLLVDELHIRDRVDFEVNKPWADIVGWLRRASVGVNGMWNEHFGIGVVEYQAAGLISVVHNSGGPKLDIVVDVDGEPTGFHASTAEEFADGFEKALSLPDTLAVRRRARKSAMRFTEEEFAAKWIVQMQRLIALKA